MAGGGSLSLSPSLLSVRQRRVSRGEMKTAELRAAFPLFPLRTKIRLQAQIAKHEEWDFRDFP